MTDAKTEPPSRILALDAVRGFAAFGILVVNVETFGGPWPLFSDEPFRDPASQLTYALVDAAFVSKFFPLFSLLFGIGLGLQMESIRERGGNVPRFVARRMAGLFVIGFLHVALLSTIDILVQYAALGFLVLAARNARPRTLVGIAAALLAVPPTFHAIAVRFHLYDAIYGDAPSSSAMIAAYSRGSFAELEAMRLLEIAGYYAWVLTYAGWTMLAMMLIGLASVRAGLVRGLDRRRDELARFARIALGVGVPTAALHAALWSTGRHAAHHDVAREILSGIAGGIAEPAMAIAYASGIAWLASRERVAGSGRIARALDALARVGRLALTSYVLQSLVMGLVAFSYGLGRYGADPPLAWLGFAVVTFAIELALATAYTQRFRMGPLEWVWRRMSYGEASTESSR